MIIRNPISRGLVENIAAFGQIEFDITDALTASFEARYQRERVTSINTSSATVTVAGVPTVFTRAINETGEYKAFLPRGTINYKVTPDAMVYGVVSHGNKPGGINAGLLSAIFDDSEVTRFRGLGITTFREEKVWNYEIGAKTSWLDNRLTLNAAAFYIDWTNQQLTQTFAGVRRDGVPANIAPTVNVGKSEVKGFEIEMTGRLSDDFSVRAGYSLTDAKIKDFVNDDRADFFVTAADIAALNATTPFPIGTAATNPAFLTQFNARLAAANALITLRGQATGQTLPRTLKHQLQGRLAWSHDFGDALRTFARADYAYESKRFT